MLRWFVKFSEFNESSAPFRKNFSNNLSINVIDRKLLFIIIKLNLVMDHIVNDTDEVSISDVTSLCKGVESIQIFHEVWGNTKLFLNHQTVNQYD